MIFVTVGAGAPKGFDELIKEVDRLKAEGAIKEKIICQIGNGSYIPEHCEWFRFEKSLEPHFKKASLVITHSGAGTLFELASYGKRTIAIANKATVENHDLMTILSRKGHIQVCGVDGLSQAIESGHHPKPYKKPVCTIHEKIKEFFVKTQS